MRRKIATFLYRTLPPNLIEFIGHSKLLAPLRNLFLRNNKVELKHIVNIEDEELGIHFSFEAPVKVAVKAAQYGIEKEISKALLHLFSHSKEKNKVIVDVGASNGFLTCFFAQTLAKNGIVLSYEPHPDVYKRLVANLTRNKIDHAHHAQVALGNEHTYTDLFVYYETANKLHFAEKKVFNTISIPMTLLDQEFERRGITKCDIIKIDVDGYEEQVLSGAINTIRAYHPVIVYETNQNIEPGKLLTENGYLLFDTSLHRVENVKKLPHDIIAIHNSKLDYHFRSGCVSNCFHR